MIAYDSIQTIEDTSPSSLWQRIAKVAGINLDEQPIPAGGSFFGYGRMVAKERCETINEYALTLRSWIDDENAPVYLFYKTDNGRRSGVVYAAFSNNRAAYCLKRNS